VYDSLQEFLDHGLHALAIEFRWSFIYLLLKASHESF
jgi:hypothetical protein